MAIDAASIIDQIASKQMGVQPSAPPQGQQQQGDSAEGNAAAKASPKTEADAMSAPAVAYEVEFGPGDKRKLTPEQIASTFNRYSQLNFRNQMLSPIHKLVETVMRENPGVHPAQLAQKMEALYRAQASNPTMGAGAPSAAPGQQGAAPQGDMDARLKKWEEENAASLPPGYKEMMTGSQSELSGIKQQLAQTQQMLAAVLGRTQGVADAARQSHQSTQSQTQMAAKQLIANNIDRAQAALQLPDDAASDFMTFASERGYSLEDFGDPQLTFRVMQDFRNNMHGPEMERLKAMASRRQAFTGSLNGSPSSGGGAPADKQQATFDAFASNIMAKKGLA